MQCIEGLALQKTSKKESPFLKFYSRIDYSFIAGLMSSLSELREMSEIIKGKIINMGQVSDMQESTNIFLPSM